MSDTQLALFRGPQARADDPDPSHVAAATITTTAGWTEFRILGAFDAHGDLTDDELAQALPEYHAPTLKTARSRLTKRGALVPSGETRLSQRGSPMTVWRLA